MLNDQTFPLKINVFSFLIFWHLGLTLDLHLNDITHWNDSPNVTGESDISGTSGGINMGGSNSSLGPSTVWRRDGEDEQGQCHVQIGGTKKSAGMKSQIKFLSET